MRVVVADAEKGGEESQSIRLSVCLSLAQCCGLQPSCVLPCPCRGVAVMRNPFPSAAAAAITTGPERSVPRDLAVLEEGERRRRTRRGEILTVDVDVLCYAIADMLKQHLRTYKYVGYMWIYADIYGWKDGRLDGRKDGWMGRWVAG